MFHEGNALCRAKDMLDSICLYPRITAGIAVQNKMTGAHSGNKSITLSFHITLFRAILWLGGMLLFMKAALSFCRWKRESMLKKKYRTKRKMKMKK